MARNKLRKTLYLQLESDLLAQIDALAAQDDRSRAAQVRRMLQRELKRLTEATPAPEEVVVPQESSAA